MESRNLGRVRGNMWYSGIGITGTSPQAAVFPSSGVTKAYTGDLYLNTDTSSDKGNVYVCTLEGDASTAKWAYQLNIRGPLPDLVDDLTSHSTTKALSANQGRVLNDKIEAAGLYPLVVYPSSETTAYTASITIENASTNFTITDDEGNTGTYSYTKIGVLDEATVTITLGTSIGLPDFGAVVKSIASSVAEIRSYTLYDENTDVIVLDTPSLWEHINTEELNIEPDSTITDGLTPYRTSVISRIIDGVRKQLFPQTHAKAVWYDKSQNKTVWDKMQRAPLTPPTTTSAYTYDGTTKTVALTGYDATKIEIQGTQSAVNAGAYHCTAHLLDGYNYCWDDGTDLAKDLVWTIASAAGILTLSTNSASGQLEPDANGYAIISTITAKSTGAVTATCPASIGTAKVVGNNVLYKPATNGAQYSGQVVVTDEGDNNYNASTATITLTNVRTLKIVSWANGTDAEIAAMVAALDAQTLSIEQTGWAVGDERTVSLSAMAATETLPDTHAAQTCTMVLMDTNVYTLTTPTAGGKTKSSFVVGLKNSLAEKGKLNNSFGYSGAWSSSDRRTWCNTVFRSAIPETLRNCFKQFKVVTASNFNASTNTTTDDYFALFAEKEIIGYNSKSPSTEAAALTHIRYYQTSANIIKKLGNSGSPDDYFERSPYKSSYSEACSIKSNGTYGYSSSSSSGGISPFGCI